MTSRWSLERWQTGRALAQQFAVLGSIIVGLITAALCLIISYYMREDVLQREWRTTTDFIRTEAWQGLSPDDFTTPESATAQQRFRRFYEQAVLMPEIIRVKVYDANMRVIWSDESRLIGQRYPDNPQLLTALSGRTAVNLETGERKVENVFEREKRELVEVYVPIMFAQDSRVVGVVETYKDPVQVFANIRKGQWMVVMTALAGGALLYLSLFWIVRRAGQRIETQHKTLEIQSREMAAANQELRAVQAQLVEAERMAAVGEVVTAVAHGIRNPLANIRASAQVALLDCNDASCPAPVPKNLSNIMGEVDRLEGRLRELLQFVRPAERQSQPLDLSSLLRATLEVMAGRLNAAQVKAEEHLADALPVIAGDPMLLEQVFMNLIGNAIEASHEGGTIVVRTGTESANHGPPMVFAEIQDFGKGITPGQMSKIFTLFYTTKSQGTGVGLPIAKKFTEAHGGTISVSSRPDEGTTFRVALPARKVP
jgi:two-component system, NtrC family, sensor histidine kinase HydH